MSGEFNRLVVAAQADQDGTHRQQAMDQIRVIAEHGGGGDNTPIMDTAAAPILAQLYPGH